MYYSSIRSAKIVLDVVTGQSKGYGFVRFVDESEQQRALEEMTGEIWYERRILISSGSKPIRVSIATPKHRFVSLILDVLV
jgi:RNA recognition motif-containing protein